MVYVFGTGGRPGRTGAEAGGVENETKEQTNRTKKNKGLY